MKRPVNHHRLRKVTLGMFFCAVPLLMGATGGCQAFTDAFFTAIESATSAAIDAALTDLFDNIRGDSTP